MNFWTKKVNKIIQIQGRDDIEEEKTALTEENEDDDSEVYSNYSEEILNIKNPYDIDIISLITEEKKEGTGIFKIP